MTNINPQNESDAIFMLHLDHLRRDVNTLLKLVRDGNGTPPLMPRVQALEHELASVNNRLQEHTNFNTTNLQRLDSTEDQLSDLATTLRNLSTSHQEFESASRSLRTRILSALWQLVSPVIVAVLVAYVMTLRIERVTNGPSEPSPNHAVKHDPQIETTSR